MIINKHRCIIMLILGSILLMVPQVHSMQQQKIHYTKKRRTKSSGYVHRGARFIGEIIIDALAINFNLFSINSAKIITAFIPPYIIVRQFDETIQSNFYDQQHHKNINQFPTAAHQAAKYGVGIPMVGLSSLALWAPDEDLRMTARIFAIALPFVHSGKDIIKNLNCKACLRPWHEDFGKDCRSSGGFPSGHMANVTFMATLFGMRHGPRWGVPLGLLATFVCADFLNCNRHYGSQLIAGACLGIMFAYAANTVIDKKLSENCNILFTCNANGMPQASIKYHF